MGEKFGVGPKRRELVRHAVVERKQAFSQLGKGGRGGGRGRGRTRYPV